MRIAASSAAIGVALWAIRLAARPAAGAWTFGWKRAEILPAAGNGITLLVVSGIVAHDLHVWTVTSSLPALSAHIVVDDSCFNDGHAPQLFDQLQACVAGHFDVEHSTFSARGRRPCRA